MWTLEALAVMAEMVGPKGRVVGIDFSEPAVQRAVAPIALEEAAIGTQPHGAASFVITTGRETVLRMLDEFACRAGDRVRWCG
jgi:hypothetical protein